MANLTFSSGLPAYALPIHRAHEIGGPTPLTMNTEWLLTDGLGGYSMGSVCGSSTRRYHGLLVVAARPPVERYCMLATLAETLRVDGREFLLDCHEYRGPDGHSVFHPHGYQHLVAFEKRPGSVRWRYRAGGFQVMRVLRRVWRRPAVVLTWRVEPIEPEAKGKSAVLAIHPLTAMRDFHQQRGADWGDPFRVESFNGPSVSRVKVEADVPVPLYMEADGGAFREERDWWHNFHRRRERERGQDDSETLFSPGAFTWRWDRADGVGVAKLYASAEPIDPIELDRDDGRGDHLNALIEHFKPSQRKGVSGFVAASDDFVVTRYVGDEEFRTILAGYPWFSDWGRDTMISLPGLLLCTGRLDEAGRTLIVYAKHMRRGLVPNRFDDYGGEPHYNTADGSLWFVHACLEYRRSGGDAAVWNDVLAPACRQVIAAYLEGTDGPIKMDNDGLIAAGDEQTQLTWMDAKRDGVVFTPRWGKCVELNALWHRALAGCAEAMGDEAYEAMAGRAKSAFMQTFWSEDFGYFFDHVNSDATDHSLRPNQVLAVSLPGGLVPEEQARRVMTAVRKKLLTPMGLRTLPRDDANYHGRHTGSMFERDKAYHQGTVWPWLIGPYVEGYLRAHAHSEDAHTHCRAALKPLADELGRHCIGQVHEIYDGDEPHRPSGCPAQAWSIAETLRAMLLIRERS